MDVYISRYEGPYGGGSVLVAANSAKEALIIAFNSDSHLFRWFCTESNSFIPKLYDGMSEFKKFEGLTFNTNTPQILDNTIYFE